jgi:hypothetical protein
VHQAENGVNLIVVQVQTLAFAEANLRLPGLAVPVHLYRHARIDAAQHADQTALDTVACGDFPRNVIFAHLRVVEIADLATEFARLTQRGTFQPRRNILTVLGEILGPDAVEVQVRLHALGMSKTT